MGCSESNDANYANDPNYTTYGNPDFIQRALYDSYKEKRERRLEKKRKREEKKRMEIEKKKKEQEEAEEREKKFLEEIERGNGSDFLTHLMEGLEDNKFEEENERKDVKAETKKLNEPIESTERINTNPSNVQNNADNKDNKS